MTRWTDMLEQECLVPSHDGLFEDFKNALRYRLQYLDDSLQNPKPIPLSMPHKRVGAYMHDILKNEIEFQLLEKVHENIISLVQKSTDDDILGKLSERWLKALSGEIVSKIARGVYQEAAFQENITSPHQQSVRLKNTLFQFYTSAQKGYVALSYICGSDAKPHYNDAPTGRIPITTSAYRTLTSLVVKRKQLNDSSDFYVWIDARDLSSSQGVLAYPEEPESAPCDEIVGKILKNPNTGPLPPFAPQTIVAEAMIDRSWHTWSQIIQKPYVPYKLRIIHGNWEVPRNTWRYAAGVQANPLQAYKLSVPIDLLNAFRVKYQLDILSLHSSPSPNALPERRIHLNSKMEIINLQSSSAAEGYECRAPPAFSTPFAEVEEGVFQCPRDPWPILALTGKLLQSDISSP
ncbi:hypothetical protein K469DRAFT_684961 [Zopfia rhizophila CBS 207.26]|uniref:Uncharacterized protein n=1 Tax=Zopfia rhizophila CBS 207.26 TaxID=1314779 RepID=A0A6A6ECF7_9PEZI|nr:hypothetical protein K469DRAFT_684961 [Zopfia rhizophila CBS 207.26]